MSRVVIVGAGAVGLCCAYALRRRGMDVLVIDRAVPGSGASHGNGGWICPTLSDPLPGPGITLASLHWLLQPESPLYIRPRLDPAFWHWLWRFRRQCNEQAYQQGLVALADLNRATMSLFDALAQDRVAFEMHCQGLLCLYLSRELARAEARHMTEMERFGCPPAQWLESGPLRAEEPAVSPAVAAGLLLPGERHVRPESLLIGLQTRLQEMGVEVRTREPVLGFERAGSVVTGVRTPRGVEPANQVVLAAGVWTARLTAQLGHSVPLEAGKGYSVTMADPASPIRRPLSLSEAHVGLSPFNGAVRVLGTMELSGINHRVRTRRLAAIKRAPAAYLREWRPGPTREEWCGPRPVTPDGLPLIGPLPGVDNVVIAAGHAMLGITLAPATAEAVSALVMGERPQTTLTPFRVDRF
ncbi:MAG TPA: FAD-dependent oxidoreductase [Chloroflexota bacterium]|nr:FAD-dependent oxidoreductase [Chloroflexota bacterium]